MLRMDPQEVAPLQTNTGQTRNAFEKLQNILVSETVMKIYKKQLLCVFHKVIEINN